MSKKSFLIHLLDKYYSKGFDEKDSLSLNYFTDQPTFIKPKNLSHCYQNSLEQMISKYKSQSCSKQSINAENHYTKPPLCINANDNNNGTQIDCSVNHSFLLSVMKSKNSSNQMNHAINHGTEPKVNHKAKQLIMPIISKRDNANSKDILIQTSDETTNMVKSIDEKIKELKLQLLYDTCLDLNKLTVYDTTFTSILSFLHDIDIKELFQSSKQINRTLYKIIRNNCVRYIIEPFQLLYGKNFIITHKAMLIRDSKGKGFNINVILQCKIKLKKKYKLNTIELSNRFSVTKGIQSKEYKNVYRFDYNYDESSTLFWMMKEDTYFNYDELSKAYVMPIVPFNANDSFHITINLLSGIGLIDFNSFKWDRMSVINKKDKIKADDVNYNSQSKQSYGFQLADYDLSRFCELELIKTKWLDYYKKNNLPELIHNEIANYILPLKELLKVDKIEYDDVGYIIVKIHALAIKTGVLQLTNLGIKLIVKEASLPIINEVRKNGLLFEMSNVIEIREGNQIVLYLSLNKYLEEIQTIIYS